MMRGLTQLILFALSLLAFFGALLGGEEMAGVCCMASLILFALAWGLEKQPEKIQVIHQTHQLAPSQNINYSTRYNDQSVTVKDSVVNRSNLQDSGEINTLKELSLMREKGQISEDEFKQFVKDALNKSK